MAGMMDTLTDFEVASQYAAPRIGLGVSGMPANAPLPTPTPEPAPEPNPREFEAAPGEAMAASDLVGAMQLNQNADVAPQSGGEGIARPNYAPQLSTAGLRAMGNVSDERNQQAQQALGHVYDQEQEAVERAKAATMDFAATQADMQRKAAEAKNRQFEAEQQHAARLEDMRKRRELRAESDKAKIAEASKLARYQDMTIEQINEQEAIINNPNATAEKRAEAAAALKDSETVRDRRSMGSKIGDAIAVGLGAYASAFGVKTKAADIVSQRIDRMIQEQRERQGQRRADEKGAINEYQRNLEYFRDEEQALAATRLQALNIAKAETEALVAGIQDEKTLAAAQETLADLDMKAAESTAKIIERGSQLEQQDFANQLAVEQQIGGRQQFNAGMKMQAAAASAKGAERAVPGLVGSGVTKEAQNDVIKQKSNIDSLERKIRELDQYVYGEDGAGFEAFGTAEAKVAKQKAVDVKMKLKNLYELGVLAGPDMELLDAIVDPDPTQIRQGAGKAKLDELLKQVRKDARDYYRSRGYANPEYEPNVRRREAM